MVQREQVFVLAPLASPPLSSPRGTRYIGLYVRSKTWGNWKYGEFDPYGKQSNFSSVYLYELFDLDADPYEQFNVINATSTSAALKAFLHKTVRAFYECEGATCM